MAKIYTRKGDDGTTGLLFGGPRVHKNSPVIEANGVVDEAQALIGVARSETAPGGDLDSMLVALERDLWVLMSEVATAPSNRHKLSPGTSLVTPAMVSALEVRIDELNERFDMPSDFVVPGQNKVSALLDVARTVVRRGERLALTALAGVEDSQVGPYLNRLSDLLWTMARWQEGEHLLARATTTTTTTAAAADGRRSKKTPAEKSAVTTKSAASKRTSGAKKTSGGKRSSGSKKSAMTNRPKAKEIRRG